MNAEYPDGTPAVVTLDDLNIVCDGEENVRVSLKADASVYCEYWVTLLTYPNVKTINVFYYWNNIENGAYPTTDDSDIYTTYEVKADYDGDAYLEIHFDCNEAEIELKMENTQSLLNVMQEVQVG